MTCSMRILLRVGFRDVADERRLEPAVPKHVE